MGVSPPIYLDHNATTPVDPRVLAAMLPWFTTHFGNASSRSHSFGAAAAEAVAQARAQVARLIGAAEREIVFTSGATESDNLAIRGAVEALRDKGNHVVTCLTEHKAVLDTCRRLERGGAAVTYLQPDVFGRVSPVQVAEAITDRTVLVTLMAANNETGTLHSIREIAKAVKARGVLFHTDAAQAVGRIPIDVDALGVDLVSLSAHKLYGPKGVGALYVRRRPGRVRLVPLMDGGGHEQGLRSGTLNVPGIVGLGMACEVALHEMETEGPRVAALRDRLHRGLAARLDGVTLNGHPSERLPNTVNLAFAYADSEGVLARLHDHVAASSGAACTSAVLEPSHVLRAMGMRDDEALSSVRFSVGRFNTEEAIDRAIEQVVAAVTALRESNPLYALAAGRPLRGNASDPAGQGDCCCGPEGCPGEG